MITRLRVKNYRCFEDFDWTPDQICLLIGQNGTGKSTLFGLLEELRRMLGGEKSVSDIFNFVACKRGALGAAEEAEIKVQLEIESARTAFFYEIAVLVRVNGKLHQVSESLLRDGKPILLVRDGSVEQHSFQAQNDGVLEFQLETRSSALSSVGDRKGEDSVAAFRAAFASVFVFKANPAQILPVSDREHHSSMEADGRNLVGWMNSKMKHEANLFASFEQDLMHCIPGLEGLKFHDVGEQFVAMQLIFDGGAGTVSFGEISDGQKVLVALCAVARLQDPIPSVLLLDEPENFLALAEIQPLIHRMLDAAQANGTQLIIASHHPELFNELAKDYGIVLSRGEDGRIGWKRYKDVEEYGLSPAEVIARGWELN